MLQRRASSYRSYYFTETLLVRLRSDIHTAIDNGEVTVLALLDLSAAFNFVDHNILLQRLGTPFGFGGLVLEWLESFVRGRSQIEIDCDSQSVHFGNLKSEWRVISTPVLMTRHSDLR